MGLQPVQPAQAASSCCHASTDTCNRRKNLLSWFQHSWGFDFGSDKSLGVEVPRGAYRALKKLDFSCVMNA